MLLGNYLYVLVFQDGRHFKVGVSSKNLERVKKLDAIYQVDHSKSFIVKSNKNGFIRILEREVLLLFDADEIDSFKSEGYSEIRNVKYIPDLIDILSSKHISWGIEIHELNFILAKLNMQLVVSTGQKFDDINTGQFLESDQITLVHEQVKNMVDSLILSVNSISCFEGQDGIRFNSIISMNPYFNLNDSLRIYSKFRCLEWTYHFNERGGSTKLVGLIGLSNYVDNGMLECSFYFPHVISSSVYKIVSHGLKVEIPYDRGSVWHIGYLLDELKLKFFTLNSVNV